MTTVDDVQEQHPVCECGCCGPAGATAVMEPPRPEAGKRKKQGCRCECGCGGDEGCECGCATDGCDCGCGEGSAD